MIGERQLCHRFFCYATFRVTPYFALRIGGTREDIEKKKLFADTALKQMWYHYYLETIIIV